jgi:hypothetical protein
MFAHGEEEGWVYFTFTVDFACYLTIDVKLRFWMLWKREGVRELGIVWDLCGVGWVGRIGCWEGGGVVGDVGVAGGVKWFVGVYY